MYVRKSEIEKNSECSYIKNKKKMYKKDIFNISSFIMFFSDSLVRKA